MRPRLFQLEISLTFRESTESLMVTGTVNQNVEPTSSFDWTPIFPPIKLTSCLDIASPRPVPPNRRVEELSACWKGTNSKSMSLGERPIPVSLWSYFSMKCTTSDYCIHPLLDGKCQQHIVSAGVRGLLRGAHNVNRTFWGEFDSVPNQVHYDWSR